VFVEQPRDAVSSHLARAVMPEFYSWGAISETSGQYDAQVYPRHCERSEAIQNPSAAAAWIASSQGLLAMTEDGAYPGIRTGSVSYPLMKLE
jgi:hypothetical protein